MIVNKFAKTCQYCNIKVNIGEGFAYNNGNRWLTVCASIACMKHLGLTPPTEKKEKSKRELTIDGKIFMPYDREALPLLRSMPGSDWKGSYRQVSVKIEDLARVLEISEQLKLKIPQELYDKLNKGTPELDAAKQRMSKLPLYDFQKTGVEFLTLHPRALLGDDLGLGKTIQAIVALPDNSKTIVICPAAVKYNWQDEFNKWRPEIKTEVLNGKKSFRLPENNEVVILNYDILPAWLSPKKENGKVKDITLPDGIVLSDVHLIVDEAHQLKNYKTIRSQKFTQLNKKCNKSWLLTGTPLLNKPFDLFGVLSACGLAFSVFGSWGNFLQLFQAYKNKFGGYEFGSPSPEVPERLRKIMLRRLKVDVLKDLPSKRIQNIVIDSIDKNLQSELDEQWSNYQKLDDPDLLPSFKEFSKIRAQLAKSRIPALIELVEEYESNETPVIIFSAHKEPVETVGNREGWAYITGDTNAQKRRDIVKDFQAGKLKGLALTIQAGGVGLTLTHASNVIFVDLDWTPAMNVQAQDRVCRIGATADYILIKQLISNHPLDKHVHALLNKKMDMITKAIESNVNYKLPKGYDMLTPELIDESEEELQNRLKQINDAAEEIEKNKAKNKIHSILSREQAKSQIPEPELTNKRKDMLIQALGYMVGQCDMAKTRDGIGFNKPDAGIAHWIYRTGLDKNDDITFRVVERILSRYYNQLHEKFDNIWTPD